MNRAIYVFAMCLMIGGCATPQVWVNHSLASNDEVQERFAGDSSECEARAIQSTSGYSGGSDTGFNLGYMLGSQGTRNRIFSNCLIGKGWTLQN